MFSSDESLDEPYYVAQAIANCWKAWSQPPDERRAAGRLSEWRTGFERGGGADDEDRARTDRNLLRRLGEGSTANCPLRGRSRDTSTSKHHEVRS